MAGIVNPTSGSIGAPDVPEPPEGLEFHLTTIMEQIMQVTIKMENGAAIAQLSGRATGGLVAARFEEQLLRS